MNRVFFCLLLTGSVFTVFCSPDISIERVKYREVQNGNSFLEPFLKKRPNYVYEVQFTIPSGSLEVLETLLLDETFLLSIPYYSRYNKTTTPLYSEIDIQSNNQINLKMIPFKPFRGYYRAERSERALQLLFSNSTAIYYRWYKAVGKHRMVTWLSVTDTGQGLQIYGIASLKVFTLFGLFGKRVDNAIEGRILALFHYLSDESLMLQSSNM